MRGSSPSTTYTSSFSEVEDPMQTNNGSGLERYVAGRKDLIRLINELSDTGIHMDVTIPKIAVVGSQSVGKSSMIEAIADIPLPRGTGTCTRCPMEVRLESSSTWCCRTSIRFSVDSRNEDTGATRVFKFGEDILEEGRGDVGDRISRAQIAARNPSTNPETFLSGTVASQYEDGGLQFTKNCVCVEVSGPDVPDLCFYDLPGVIASVGDNESRDNKTLVTELVESYISQPNCIILCLITCETDAKNQGAWDLVMKDESRRRRTVGVLTKVDRIEPLTGDLWLKVFQNQTNHLERGWYAVCLPTEVQRAASISRETARLNERARFERHPWATEGDGARNRLGVHSLVRDLGDLLEGLIREELPKLYGPVLQELRRVDRELEPYLIETSVHPRTEVISLLSTFTIALTKSIKGSCLRLGSSNDSLPYQLNGLYQTFYQRVHATAPIMHPWSSKYQLKKTADLQWNMPEIGNGAVMELEEVMVFADRSRTYEAPYILPMQAIVSEYVNVFQTVWKDLAIECFEHSRAILVKHVLGMVVQHFGRFESRGLLDLVKKIIDERIQARGVSTRERVRALCNQEQSTPTQNLQDYTRYYDKFLSKVQFTSNETPPPMVQSAVKIMAHVNAYFQVAYKRFGDIIPMEIDYNFVQGLERDVDTALRSLDLTEEICQQWLGPSEETERQRLGLLDRKTKLESARDFLANSGMALPSAVPEPVIIPLAMYDDIRTEMGVTPREEGPSAPPSPETSQKRPRSHLHRLFNNLDDTT